MREAATRRPSIDIPEFERRPRGPRPVDAREKDSFEELERMLYGDKAAAPAEREHFEEEASQRSSASSIAQIDPPANSPHREDAPFNHEVRGSLDDAAPQTEQRYERETNYRDQHADWPRDESLDYLDFGMQGDEQRRSAHEEGEGKFRFRKLRPWRVAAGIAALAIGSASLTFAHYNGGGATVQKVERAVAPNKSAIADEDGSAPERKVARNEELPIADAPRQPTDGSALTPPPMVEQARPEAASDNDPPRGVGADQALASPREPKFAVNSADANVDLASPVASASPQAATHEQSARRKAEKVASALQTENDAPRSGGRSSLEVRFGSAETPAEARKLMKQIASKFGSRFGGHALGYRHAKVDGKRVYLIRLRRDLGKDAATGLCERVTASGGSCTVAEK